MSLRTTVAAVAAVALGFVVLVGLGLGLRGGQAPDKAPPRPRASSDVPAPAVYTATGRATDIRVRASAAGFPPAPPVVARVRAGAVLRITAFGFTPHATGAVQQCTADRCTNAFPVVFDAGGHARFQYQLDVPGARDARGSECRAHAPPCAVHVSDGDRDAFAVTVFREVAPPPRRVVLLVDDPDGRVRNGASVRLHVEGFAPRERLRAVLCAAPATHGTRRCGTPGPVAAFAVDAAGTGATSLVVDEGPVGSSGARCDRHSRCGIVVLSGGGRVPGPVVPIVFAAEPGARYEAGRLAGGLTLAVVLGLAAVVLVRRTDWRQPSEADTPELDEVRL